jgi:hypothetical protein
MTNRVKSISEINEEDVDVTMRGPSILQYMDESLKMTGCIVASAKALLSLAENVMILGVVRENFSDKPGPHFINSVTQSDGPFVLQVGRIVFLMKQSRV